MGSWLLILLLIALAAWSIWLGFVGWNLESDVAISGHGYVALILGVVLSLVVGIALMALVFYSSRKGYDEEVGRDRARPPEERPDARNRLP